MKNRKRMICSSESDLDILDELDDDEEDEDGETIELDLGADEAQSTTPQKSLI